MRKWVFVLTLLAALGACKPPPLDVEPEDAPPESALPSDELAAEPELNIGDVEQGIDVEASLAPESKSAQIVATQLTDKMGRVKILRLEVSPPYPRELWLDYKVNARRNFVERPAVLRGRMLADGKRELASFALVLGSKATRNTFSTRINALEGVEAMPETLGIHVEAEALLLPEGTDEATIDPATASSDETSGAVYQTAVRINFAQLESTPVENLETDAAAETEKAETPAAIPAPPEAQ
jgi:hypothetical protein